MVSGVVDVPEIVGILPAFAGETPVLRQQKFRTHGRFHPFDSPNFLCYHPTILANIILASTMHNQGDFG